MSDQITADEIESFINRSGDVALAQMIKNAWIGFMQGTHTATPGQIVSYDAAKRLAAVQPVLQQKYLDEDKPRTIPAIPGIPVQWFFGVPGAAVLIPDSMIKSGMEGILLCCERSIDLWYSQGGIIDPADNRMFDFTDAIFLLGLASIPNMPVRNGASTSLEMQYGSAWIEITNDSPGKFKISNGTYSLKQIESDMVSMVSNALCAGSGSPLTFTSPTPTSVNAEISGLFK